MEIKPKNQFEIDLRNNCIRFRTSKIREITGDDIRITFGAKNALLHLGVMALVADCHKNNKNFEAIKVGDIHNQVKRLAFLSAQRGGSALTDLYGTIREFCRSGYTFENERKNISVTINGKLPSSLPIFLKDHFKVVINASGTPNINSLKLHLNKAVFDILGIAPADITYPALREFLDRSADISSPPLLKESLSNPMTGESVETHYSSKTSNGPTLYQAESTLNKPDAVRLAWDNLDLLMNDRKELKNLSEEDAKLAVLASIHYAICTLRAGIPQKLFPNLPELVLKYFKEHISEVSVEDGIEMLKTMNETKQEFDRTLVYLQKLLAVDSEFRGALDKIMLCKQYPEHLPTPRATGTSLPLTPKPILRKQTFEERNDLENVEEISCRCSLIPSSKEKPALESAVLPRKSMRQRLTTAAAKSAKVVSEWMWEDNLEPSVEFLNDDVIALGGVAASFTIMKFATRRALFYDKIKANERIIPQIDLASIVDRETAFSMRSGSNNGDEASESREETLKRNIDDLASVLRYSKIILSPDKTLLACFRNDGPRSNYRGAVDVWDILKWDKPRKITSVSPQSCLEGFTLEGSLSIAPAFSFTSNSTELILTQSNPFSRLAIVDARTGCLLKTVKFIEAKDSKRYAGLISFGQFLPRPDHDEIAVLQNFSGFSAKWKAINPNRRCTGRELEWAPTGVATTLPGTNDVICSFDLLDRKATDCELSIWNWNGKRIASLAGVIGYPDLICTHNSGKFFVLISAYHQGARIPKGLNSRDGGTNVIVQVFASKPWRGVANMMLPLAGSPLAFRVCQNGQIRGITASTFASSGKIRCQLKFWEIETSL